MPTILLHLLFTTELEFSGFVAVGFHTRLLTETTGFFEADSRVCRERRDADTTDKDLYIQTPVGLLCIDEESPQANPPKVGIVLEGNLVMGDLASLPQAFCILFGLSYALHLNYPEYMKNTFSFVQQVSWHPNFSL
ncbi:sterile alpha motif domain-containing protein 3-like protein [Lates japonicus]|uniref:Sterile alpha motif domain-containing protein 3-like protein n=1 Tax=Lates japonicus TaxID=270547 RepID=A0AAD3M4U6_LATJO|nr:sterile alpha motif domain-containing protein 3-like protein [Lates japonicus]